MSSSYLVLAGYVTATTAVGAGQATVDFPRGSILPGDVPDEQIQTLLKLGHIAETQHDRAAIVVEPAAVEPGPADIAGVPAGMSVATTLTWVGDDRQRARAALGAERVSGSPRSTLIARLEAVLG